MILRAAAADLVARGHAPHQRWWQQWSAEDERAAAQQRLGAKAAGFKLGAIAAFDDGSVYVLNDQSPAGKIAGALGLAPLPTQQTKGEAVDLISTEQLAAVKGGNVVDLTEDESQQLHFDSVLTVGPNAALLERLVTAALA
jgi:hypothetical protein